MLKTCVNKNSNGKVDRFLNNNFRKLVEMCLG